jgi:ubiquinone/menaquinone biosynthesis C-methylase UbiE
MRRSAGVVGTSRYEWKVLELGARTGCLTRPVAPRRGPTGRLVATNRSELMLTIAQRDLLRGPVTFALVDYTGPLPFLDSQFRARA